LEAVRGFAGEVYLRISIYSVYQKKNESITKSKMPVEEIRQNIEGFMALRNAERETFRHVHVYAKILDSYSQENEDFLQTYGSLVDEVEIEQPMNWSGDGERNLLADAYDESLAGKLEQETMPKVCAYPFHTLAIQSDGKVVCCCVDWSRKTCVGDVTKESLVDIWNGDALQKLRLQHLSGHREANEACRNCHHLPHGGSYEKDSLDTLTPDEFLRRETKI